MNLVSAIRNPESSSLNEDSPPVQNIHHRIQVIVEGLLRLMADLAQIQSEKHRTDERTYKKEVQSSADYMRRQKIALIIGISLTAAATSVAFCTLGCPVFAQAAGRFGQPLLQQGFLALRGGSATIASTAFQTAQMAAGSITDSRLKELETGPTLLLNKLQSSGQGSQQDRAIEDQLRSLLQASGDLLISAARSN